MIYIMDRASVGSLRLGHDLGLLVAGLMALTYGVALSYLSVIKHQTFNSTAFDLGFFDQALWNTLQGRLLHTSLVVASPERTNYFAEHVSPVLIPLSLIYLLGNDVRILLVFQGLVTGAGAVTVYLLANLRCGTRAVALTMAAAYLALPTIILNNLFDFHPDMFLVPLLPLAFYFIYAERYRAFVITAIGMLSLKETVAIFVFMLGLYLTARARKRALGLMVTIGSLFWFFLCVNVIAPYFRGAPYHHLGRYNELGDSIGAILLNLLANPMALIQTAQQPNNSAYLLSLLLPLAGLPLFSPIELTVAVPMLLVNMLSATGMQSNLAYQYTLPVVSIMFVAAIESIRRLKRWSEISLRRPRLALPLANSLSFFLLGLTVLTTLAILPQYVSTQAPFVAPSNAANIVEASALIPADASLATSNALAPHFSHRRELRLFPPLEVDGQLQSVDTQFVLVNLRDDRWSGIPEDKLSGVNSTRYLVATLIDPASYEAIYSKKEIQLFRRR